MNAENTKIDNTQVEGRPGWVIVYLAVALGLLLGCGVISWLWFLVGRG